MIIQISSNSSGLSARKGERVRIMKEDANYVRRSKDLLFHL